jgi:hypothetical protein
MTSALAGRIASTAVRTFPDGVWLGAPLHLAARRDGRRRARARRLGGAGYLLGATAAHRGPAVFPPARVQVRTRTGKIGVGLPAAGGAELPEVANLQPRS